MKKTLYKSNKQGCMNTVELAYCYPCSTSCSCYSWQPELPYATNSVNKIPSYVRVDN